MKRIRLARRRRTVGLSQEALAEQLGVDRSTVVRWEQGQTEPQPWQRPNLAIALRLTVEELDGLLLDDEDCSGAMDRQLVGWRQPTVNARRYPIVGGADDIRRRTLLVAGGIAALSALDPSRHSADGGGQVATVRIGAVADRLGAALLSPKSDEAPGALDLMIAATRAWQLRQAAQYEALGNLLLTLVPQAEAGLDGACDADRLRMTYVYVHTYNSASSLFKRVGNEMLAMLAADRAARAAQHVDSPLVMAAAMFRVANVLLAAGRLGEAQSIAIRGAELVAPMSLSAPRDMATRGGLLLTAAVAAARSSDRDTACQLLDEANAVAETLGSDHADMCAIFGPTNVAVHRVQVAVELGDGHAATRYGQQVDAARLPAGLAERRGQFLIDMAQAYAQGRQFDEAEAAIVEAEHVAPQEVQLSGQAHDIVQMLLHRPHAATSVHLRAVAQRIGLER